MIGAYYYLRVIKVMYLDEPAPAFQRSDEVVQGGMIAAAALFVSPLGWIVLAPLGNWTMTAAKALF